MVIADGESPYKNGKAYPKCESELLDTKLSMAGLSGLAYGSMFNGRRCRVYQCSRTFFKMNAGNLPRNRTHLSQAHA